MKKITATILLFSVVQYLSSCKQTASEFDASGSFETEETIISSEATGILNVFDIEEGQDLKAGDIIGKVDTIQLFLRKKQLQAQIQALLVKKPNVNVQLAALEQQLKTANTEQIRISNLVKADAATTKQLDDVNANIEIFKKQIDALKSSLEITANGINNDVLPMQVQIQQIEDQLKKCTIINPINGTVLTKYAEQNEMTSPGKSLYKIADLSTIILRAYITANQLPQIKLNQKVKVLTDDGKAGYTTKEGTITWINDKAEFTPKTIQTKDERASMVYAIKIKIPNDGTYKIGMYGEIKF